MQIVREYIGQRGGRAASRKGGFTLMEVALAVSVVVIGLMALFALVSSGLDSSTLAVKDTHAAMFADNVFNGLRATSQAHAELGTNINGDVYWRMFWADFASARTTLTVAASSVWDADAGSYDIRASRYIKGGRGAAATYDPSMRKLRFDNRPQHADLEGDPLVNHALRYRLEIRPGDVGFWLTDVLENESLSVTLFVWPGEFGSTNDPIIFYSEFDNAGDL